MEEVALLGLFLLIYTLIFPFFVNHAYWDCSTRPFLKFYFGRPRTYNCFWYVFRVLLFSFSLVWYLFYIIIDLFFDKIFMPFADLTIKAFNIFNCRRKFKRKFKNKDRNEI